MHLNKAKLEFIGSARGLLVNAGYIEILKHSKPVSGWDIHCNFPLSIIIYLLVWVDKLYDIELINLIKILIKMRLNYCESISCMVGVYLRKGVFYKRVIYISIALNDLFAHWKRFPQWHWDGPSEIASTRTQFWIEFYSRNWHQHITAKFRHWSHMKEIYIDVISMHKQQRRTSLTGLGGKM